MRLRIKNFIIMGVHSKIRILVGVTKNQYIGEDCLKRGALGQFADIRGGLGEKEGVVLLGGGGGLIPQCTLWLLTMLCCLLSSSGIRKLW